MVGAVAIDPNRTYSLVELIDLAEAHDPDTRAARQHARERAAALGVARSELYPTLAVAAVSQTSPQDDLVRNAFVRQTLQVTVRQGRADRTHTPTAAALGKTLRQNAE